LRPWHAKLCCSHASRKNGNAVGTMIANVTLRNAQPLLLVS